MGSKLYKPSKLQIFIILIGALFFLHVQYQFKETFIEGNENMGYNPNIIRGTLNDDEDGIRRDQIPPGNDHLYVLKSKIVPPVCPKCPDVVKINKCDDSNKKCTPCPPCGRCPESPFECKKVPVYSRFNNPIVRPFMNSPDMN